MFDSLSDRLGDVFDRLRRHGALTETDVGTAMREIRVALLEADVALPVVRDFVAAVRETIEICRSARKPYAIVINAAPVKREEQEAPIVAEAREGLAKLRVPVWGGQITQRTNFCISLASGEGVREYDADSPAAAEIGRLWAAIAKSVQAIEGAYSGAVMHKAA